MDLPLKQPGTKDRTILRPEESAGYLVRDTHLLFAKALRNRLQNHQITPGQWYFLRTLWDEEGLSQRELSRRVGTTEPTTVSALRLLTRNCMIERVRNITGTNKPVESEAARFRPENSEVRALIADPARFNGATGWMPATDLNAGLEKTVAWWQQRIAANRVRRDSGYLL